MKDKAILAIAAAPVVAVFLILGPMVFGVARMELGNYQERQAVRAAIRGDCSSAMDWAASAGRIPYDVTRLCEPQR